MQSVGKWTELVLSTATATAATTADKSGTYGSLRKEICVIPRDVTMAL